MDSGVDSGVDLGWILSFSAQAWAFAALKEVQGSILSTGMDVCGSEGGPRLDFIDRYGV